MDSRFNESLSPKDKQILSKLSELGQTTMYTLAKETNTPYSSTFNSVKKLESLGLIKEDLVSGSGRKKIIYVTTGSGNALLTDLSEKFEIGIKQAFDPSTEPLNDNMILFLLSQSRETAEIDFKATLELESKANFIGVAKDIFAMANYGGGFLVIGYRETETGTFEPDGLPENFHCDQAKIQEKFNAYSNIPLAIGYREFGKDGKKFAVLHVPPAPVILKPIKYGCFLLDNGKQRTVFSTDEVLFRRGTQSITASEEEIKFIERRSKESEYQIGLLNGMPDKVREKLFGNFFKIEKLPEKIYSAIIPSNIRFLAPETKGLVYIRKNDEIFSFCDIDQEPFRKYIASSSLKCFDTLSFCENSEARITVTWLLNSEIRDRAIKMGLRFDHWNKNTFFYPLNPGLTERIECWEGWFKKSKRIVAKLTIDSLGRSIFAHSAASISFRYMSGSFYLRINPEIVLTHDGYESIQGFREGTVKTRLSYNQYNNSYLNLILFWVSRFKATNKDMVNLNDRILISSTPVSVDLNFGIRSDRPVGEFSRRNNELYLIGEESG